ncbi:hypothetical protein BDV93DRAFT_123836 [Ceratobasidium sp. AG-I]|nr:hypothetical protein BDV93DRAFT_123836 [Ceratobasidium sp. AG-I]
MSPWPCRSPYLAVCFRPLIRSLDQFAFGAWLVVVQMAKFTGKSPSADKAFAFGQRVRVDAGDVFPDEATVGVAPFRDLEGRPLYVGTMILDDSAIPCQIDPQALMKIKRPATRTARQMPCI